MHGWEGENRKRNQHMRSVPTRGTRTVAGDLVASPSGDSFYKGGRRICVGDCALFKPPQDSPPFIGIIRSLAPTKEHNLQLSVNWLYRPAEVKLGKGILPDASPNEIFYSFHQDEIPAASLLHPCKVAFLPKGVELPPGISSFVCWRVYDVKSKCLWWLTDQDYITERQEEVDQLLYKTRTEMHATVQSGGRSPKPVNGPTSTSQLKPSSDNVQNSSTFPTQIKAKKRERGDAGSEPVKRERSLKTDDGDSSQLKLESILKTEIAKITERGGLVELEGVEKLVQLMQPERVDKKMDLSTRSILAGVVAATDKFDCLNKFVQLRGLPVLDEWLQDVHKGKIGDSGSPKEGDKSIEDFLLVLLRSLDKLPVNLHALQMCNIGRSVNHLRTHKNLEIQKKARTLVDTWKKRVEAEMNMIDAKSGLNQAVSWPSKSRLPDVSHGGNRYPVGSSEVPAKSSITQISASKITPLAKPAEGEAAIKSASSSPGPTKSVQSPAVVKDGQPRVSVGGTVDPPSIAAREDKSSSSSQSPNYSQSFSGKDDTRSSSAGSMSVSKISSGASRHRKPVTSLGGAVVSGGQRETRSSRNSSLNKNSGSEKLLQSGLTCEKAVDVPVVEGNGNKLIVKIPNRGRSPAQSASGGSFEDPSMMNSRASSPVLPEKQEQFDRSLKDKNDGYRPSVTPDVNNESWQSNDFKDALTGSDEGDGSPAAVADEERSRTADENKKLPEVLKAASSSSGNELKLEKLCETSFNPMNALIESCKYSEANASMSPGDNLGMNLLASVAAGEMSKSDLMSPMDSPLINGPLIEEAFMGDDTRSKPEDLNPQDEKSTNDEVDMDTEKQVVPICSSLSKDGVHLSMVESVNISGDKKTNSPSSEGTAAAETMRWSSVVNLDVRRRPDPCIEANEKKNQMRSPAPTTIPRCNWTENMVDGEVSKILDAKVGVKCASNDDVTFDAKPNRSNSLPLTEKIDPVPTIEDEKPSYNALSDVESKNKIVENERFCSVTHVEQKPLLTMAKSDLPETNKGEHATGSGRDLISENSSDNVAEKDSTSNVGLAEVQVDREGDDSLPVKRDIEIKGEVEERATGGSMPRKDTSAFSSQETEHLASKESKQSVIEAGEKRKNVSFLVETSSSSAAGLPGSDAKLKFDLNEGFITDDGKKGEPITLMASGCSTSVHTINSMPLAVSSVSSNLPSSITVAAAAKGAFVPPDDLLKSKGELGWKGSAATSAFRPAEPRKVLEMALSCASSSLPESVSCQQGRFPLDIDLNVPDERLLKDTGRENGNGITCATDFVCSSLVRNELVGSVSTRITGGLDLDLNLADDANDMGQYSMSSSARLEVPLLQVKPTSMGRISNGEVRRDFDLNDGPNFDEVNVEPSTIGQQSRNGMLSQPLTGGHRMNNPEIVNFSSLFTSASVYSSVPIPSVLSERVEQQPFQVSAPGAPQRILGPATTTPFTPDVYRGSVLSSSPATPFSSAFTYPVFPFGTSFSLPSNTFSGGSAPYMDSTSGGRHCFPAVPSQLMGPVGPVSSQFPRPCVINVPDGGGNGGVESNRKWGRQSLDLNAGPGVLDLEGRDETAPMASRQHAVTGSQALADEQTRIYHVANSVMKRKEPEGGWENEGIRYKQSSWQ